MTNIHKTFLLLLIISFGAIAQDLDQSFLDSLPSEMGAELLIQQQKHGIETKVFNPPETDVKLISENLEKIKSDLILIESSLNEGIDDQSNLLGNDLRVIGENFFDSFQSTFMPINEPHLGSNYILDVGDTINLQLVGQKNEEVSIIVARDGSIFAPYIGKIVVSGLSFDKVYELISAKYKESFLGIDAFVTLANLRDKNILIIGAVRFPGTYTLSGGASALQAIDIAGGISSNGSFRNIKIKRNNQVIENIDLYEVLLKGNINFTTFLQSGDVIVVEPKGKTVSISGGVNIPGIYELKESEKLEDLFNFAKGFKPGTQKIIEIYAGNSDPVKIINESSDMKSFVPDHGSDIKIPEFISYPIPIKQVEISGEVKNPGIYSFRDGERLSDLIIKAGGYTLNAYEPGGILIRESAKSIEKSINLRNYNEMIKFIATSANAKDVVANGGDTLLLILNELKNSDPTGRVSAEFDVSKIRKSPERDTIIQANDKIYVPHIPQEIYVLGEVVSPGTRLYSVDFSVKDYISRSGGMGLYADKSRLVVIHPNGDSYLWSGGIGNLFSNNLSIIPGSVIYVPREIGKLNGLNYASVIAPIFSSLAISLASLNSISD